MSLRGGVGSDKRGARRLAGPCLRLLERLVDSGSAAAAAAVVDADGGLGGCFGAFIGRGHVAATSMSPRERRSARADAALRGAGAVGGLGIGLATARLAAMRRAGADDADDATRAAAAAFESASDGRMRRYLAKFVESSGEKTERLCELLDDGWRREETLAARDGGGDQRDDGADGAAARASARRRADADGPLSGGAAGAGARRVASLAAAAACCLLWGDAGLRGRCVAQLHSRRRSAADVGAALARGAVDAAAEGEGGRSRRLAALATALSRARGDDDDPGGEEEPAAKRPRAA